jgi:hypothetical protein
VNLDPDLHLTGTQMLTWLDRLCRQAVPLVDTKWHGGDPRRALGFHIHQRLYHAKTQAEPFEDILDEAFHIILIQFIRDFFPAGVTWEAAEKTAFDRPLGLVLTRNTANLLSGADAHIPDETWRPQLGENRAIYVDIPPGTVLLDEGVQAPDMLQLRAIFAAPFLPPAMPKHTLFIAQMTDRGSERSRGKIAGVLCPDGNISMFGSETTGKAVVDRTLRPPFVHPLTDKAVVARTGTFLRLVLAYHFFGPSTAHEPIAAAPAARLRNGKPRKDESLFALTRLLDSPEVGRSNSTVQSSWSLMNRQAVAGHFKLQAYGPERSLRRLIWVDEYERGPNDAPIKPRAFVV